MEAELTNTPVQETLSRSSEPPADNDRMIIEESMASADAQLGIEIFREEAATLDTTADHSPVLSSSPFQTMPEDVLREICITFIGSDFPILAPGTLPLPYMLMQISSGIRHIVLTTPSIWASIHIQIPQNHYDPPGKELFTALVCEAREWFDRAGCLPLNISVENLNDSYPGDENDELGADPATILLDFLLSLSSRWSSIHFACSQIPTFLEGIAALSAADVPQLRSISIYFEYTLDCMNNSDLFTIPTMERLTLEFSWGFSFDLIVDWTLLTSLTLGRCRRHRGPSAIQIARILQQTRRLSFCDVSVSHGYIENDNYPGEINLPLLKKLYIDQQGFDRSSEFVNLINAPILEVLHLRGELFVASTASAFFKRSPNIRELSLRYTNSLAEITELLKHFPSLTELSLQPRWRSQTDTLDANTFLRAFFREDDDVICPCLEYFTLGGSIDVSLETLRQFLEAKRRGVTASNDIRPWKRVSIDLRGITDMGMRQQMSDLFV